MINRHDRRAAAARAKRRRMHDRFYLDHIRHLPQVPLDAPLKRGRAYHSVTFHDHWCRFYDHGRVSDCNCNPTFSRYIEPVRS
jgi:hypothetical protein